MDEIKGYLFVIGMMVGFFGSRILSSVIREDDSAEASTWKLVSTLFGVGWAYAAFRNLFL